MFAKILVVVCLATLIVAQVPSYIKICGRRNPNLAKCAVDSVIGLREKLKEGMPEFGAPPLEPLYFEGFPLSETERLRLYTKNVKISGLSNYKVTDVKLDFETKILEIETFFKKVTLDADYDVAAKIIVTIGGRGPVHIEADDIYAKGVMKYKFIKKNGKDYVFFTAMTSTVLVKDWSADFKASNETDPTITSAINAAIDGGRQEIFSTMRPTLERVLSEQCIKLANMICSHYSFDELMPDRE